MRGVEREGEKSPEDERMRRAGERTLGNGGALADDVDQEPRDARAEAIDREGVRCGGDQPDAGRDLRGKGADEDHDQQPEGECFHQ